MASFLCLRLKLRRKPVRVGESGFKKEPGPARMTKQQISKLTMSFSRSRVIAFGGFSTVYLGKFPNSGVAAVKVIDSGSSHRLSAVFRQELQILQRVRHESIVRVLGYCDEGEEGVLVFQYAANGTLHENIHGKWDSVLSWKQRMGIAYQLAQALEYLHEKCDPQIVHGDIKSSNVLLDSQFNCKLCDFGSAKMGFSSSVQPPLSGPEMIDGGARGRDISAATRPKCGRLATRMMMMGSPGYTDPHYLRTGIATKKSDIYSFGVILLELITGLEAISSSDCNERLVCKARQMLKDESKVTAMVDPRLDVGNNNLGVEVEAVASIAAMCLVDCPTLRPSASHILETMRIRVPSVGFLFSKDKGAA
ncbi:unnamed protein product [Cuscuta europaea]|uniref:Protein kinase domain-containing protein n=1 Tax=Cuscuta europaea TaxID=41803 RepID=A0A9P0ZQW3_CUSEU|nr:unnamed protein product [Cuscuta europaea]